MPRLFYLPLVEPGVSLSPKAVIKTTSKLVVCSDPRGGSTCRPLEGVRKDYHCIACSATGKPVIFASRSISASGISLAEISASLCGARCFSSSFLSACTSQNISAKASLFTPGRTRGFVKPEGNKKSRKNETVFAA